MTTLRVALRLTVPATIQLAYSLNSDMSDYSLSDPVESNAGNVAKFTVSGLAAATKYYVQAYIADLLAGPVGSAVTAATGRHSFSFWAASCARSGSTQPIFDAIRTHSPALERGIHTGDLHYDDIATNSVAVFMASYDNVFDSTQQHQLYREIATSYIWDDHDYGPNNSDSTSPSREASAIAYRLRVPHAPLVQSSGPIYRREQHGRVVFLITDLRHERTSSTMLGSTQKAWFIDQLSDEANDGMLLCWVNTVPWIGTHSSDMWGVGDWADERVEIANAIKAAGVVGRFFSINGDMHGLAIDDGTNSDYATGGGAAFPVFQAAPLDQSNSSKGGPWSEGSKTDVQRQVGIITIDDDREDPDEIGVTLTGKFWNGSALETWKSLSFVANVGA